MLDRGAVIVRPKQPYLDWAASLDDSDIVPDREGERTVYLVPEYGDDFEAMEVLAEAFDIIFEEELNGWHTDESAWPANRTFSMFREWFDVEFHSVVDDICGYEIVDDDVET